MKNKKQGAPIPNTWIAAAVERGPTRLSLPSSARTASMGSADPFSKMLLSVATRHLLRICTFINGFSLAAMKIP
jgi:hypothetical protein